MKREEIVRAHEPNPHSDPPWESWVEPVTDAELWDLLLREDCTTCDGSGWSNEAQLEIQGHEYETCPDCENGQRLREGVTFWGSALPEEFRYFRVPLSLVEGGRQ